MDDPTGDRQGSGAEPGTVPADEADATVVVPRRQMPVDAFEGDDGLVTDVDFEDPTVVVTRRSVTCDGDDGVEVDIEIDADADDMTVVVPRPRRDELAHEKEAAEHDPDATIVAAHAANAANAANAATAARPQPLAPEVLGPAEPAWSWSTGAGVRAIPRVYGARPAATSNTLEAPDLVQRTVGAPPPARDEAPVAERPALPALARRFRRARTLTLGAYAVAVVVSAAGLWAIAHIAFG